MVAEFDLSWNFLGKLETSSCIKRGGGVRREGGTAKV